MPDEVNTSDGDVPRPPTRELFQGGGTQKGDIEDTRFAINDAEGDIKKYTRLITQLIKSNDPRAVSIVPFIKDKLDLSQSIDSILEDHLKKIGGR